MLISVVIPTCNRNESLVQCLNLLLPEMQKINFNNYEIIVTDDSIKDLAKNLIEKKYPSVRWVQGPKRGRSANRNYGASQARGQWIVFIDDDCLPDINILYNYKVAISNYPGDQAFEGSIIPDSWELLKEDLAECPVNTQGNYFWTANVAINKCLFNRTNGFNENYLFAQEDDEMRIDIEKITGRKIKFLKDCIVIHPVRITTVKKLLKKIPGASKNFSMYAVKNKDVLGYNSLAKFGFILVKNHCAEIFRVIKDRKIKNLSVSLAWLFYGVPLSIFYFFKFKKTTKYHQNNVKK